MKHPNAKHTLNLSISMYIQSVTYSGILHSGREFYRRFILYILVFLGEWVKCIQRKRDERE